MINKLKNKTKELYYRKLLKNQAKRLINRHCIKTNPSSTICFLSMVQKKDLYMYLLAVTSLARFITPGKIIVVKDPSIGKNEVADIIKAIPQALLINAIEFRQKEIPVGGCWERITAIADMVPDGFVIQIDADTLTLSRPEELEYIIQKNRSFTLGTYSGTEISAASLAVDFANQQINNGSNHIQMHAESKLNTLAVSHYIRGCAGFAGYAKGSFNRDTLVNICNTMRNELKHRWNEWGTEQFTSNVIIANTENSEVLPLTRYNAPTEKPFETMSLVHFIGPKRFINNRYSQAAKKIVDEILSTISVK